MAAHNSVDAAVSDGDPVAGFAKLQGENFAYIMQKYSIILGRNSIQKDEVDLDLSILGGRVARLSRHHARIFYDFEHRHFALEVLGKNGCRIQGVSYVPGSDPVKLNSQDLIEIAGKQFYFLLPSCSIYATSAAQRNDSGTKVSPRSQEKLKKQNKKSSRGGESISSSYGVNATPDEHAS